MKVTLRFSHRSAATGRDVFGAGPSVASFDLTTGTSDRVVRWSPNRETAPMDVLLTGQPMQPDGRIKVVDNSNFSGGFLGGPEALLEIEGRLNPIP